MKATRGRERCRCIHTVRRDRCAVNQSFLLVRWGGEEGKGARRNLTTPRCCGNCVHKPDGAHQTEMSKVGGNPCLPSIVAAALVTTAGRDCSTEQLISCPPWRRHNITSNREVYKRPLFQSKHEMNTFIKSPGHAGPVPEVTPNRKRRRPQTDRQTDRTRIGRGGPPFGCVQTNHPLHLNLLR
ncbi:hypothetical protein J6590_082484 [Homalodisca vitripennis]|nr:hypothetical protein J6590_082484 [Homalodisca vitripennis]